MKNRAMLIGVICCTVSVIAVMILQYGTFQSDRKVKSVLEVTNDIKRDFLGHAKVKHIENFSIVSTCSDEEISGLINIIEWIRNQCQILTGKDQISFSQKTTIFYFRTKKEYRTYYKVLTGAVPSSLLGTFRYDRNALFGSRDVGNGTIAHELVHVFILQDWPNWQTTFPGWLNESLAVTIGCPHVGSVLGGKYVSDVNLYCAKAAIEEEKWISVDSMFQQTQASYDYPQTKLGASGEEALSVSFLTTAWTFTRWLASAGLLPQFYQNYRDTQNYHSALKSIGYSSVLHTEAPLRSWILSHDETKYIFDKDERVRRKPLSRLTDIRTKTQQDAAADADKLHR